MLLEVIQYVIQMAWGYAEKKVVLPVEDWVS
jgi:hypothetical protein